MISLGSLVHPQQKKDRKRADCNLLVVFIPLQLTGKDLPFMPPKRGNLFLVPNGIRPVLQRTGIEVCTCCWLSVPWSTHTYPVVNWYQGLYMLLAFSTLKYPCYCIVLILLKQTAVHGSKMVSRSVHSVEFQYLEVPMLVNIVPIVLKQATWVCTW